MTGDPWEDWWDRPSVPMRPLALRPGEEPRRPDDPAVMPFHVCLPFEYDSGLAPYAGTIVPIEHVRPGDRQIVVQGRVGVGTRDEPAELDRLNEIESLESVIVDRPIRLTRPLPGVRELIVTTLVSPPDDTTLRYLPNLRRLCLGRSQGESRIDLRTLVAMPDLEDLRFDASQVSGIEPIAGLTRLRRLRIENQTFESIAPLTAATELRWLAIGWWKGMDRLGSLTELEHVELNEGTVSSLRAFREWRRLRSLTIFGRRLKSIAGIEQFEALEDLFLYNTAVADLAPLAASASLRRLRLDMPTKVADFAPIARLERLESLIVNFKGARSASVPRLADLSGLRNLRDLALIKADGEGWRFLLDLPDLRRIQLFGSVDADAPDLIQGQFPGARVDVRPVTLRSPSVDVKRLPDGRYSIYADVSDLLGVNDNFEAEERLRGRLLQADPELLDRLEFDSEADALSVTGPFEADLLRVIEEVTRR
jgi:Leucine-rich repeat (LRR) protein